MKALFLRGITFHEFIDKDAYQDKILDIYKNIMIEESLIKEIEEISKDIYVLVFAEIWCPDCMINVPALQKISDLNQHIKIRIVPREGNEAYMENYKINGKPKIPTFVFMNGNFEEIGTFIEQPQIVKDVVAKGKQVDIIVVKRKYNKGEYAIETVREILNILK
ncbi:MAG: thioredoxin family protein [Bacillota bacterium]